MIMLNHDKVYLSSNRPLRAAHCTVPPLTAIFHNDEIIQQDLALRQQKLNLARLSAELDQDFNIAVELGQAIYKHDTEFPPGLLSDGSCRGYEVLPNPNPNLNSATDPNPNPDPNGRLRSDSYLYENDVRSWISSSNNIEDR